MNPTHTQNTPCRRTPHGNIAQAEKEYHLALTNAEKARAAIVDRAQHTYATTCQGAEKDFADQKRAAYEAYNLATKLRPGVGYSAAALAELRIARTPTTTTPTTRPTR